MTSSDPATRAAAAGTVVHGTEVELTGRGARRRDELIAATLRLIVRDGPGAVTLRTVVTEAGASHGSVAYYFGTREELMRCTLALTAERNIQALVRTWKNVESDQTDLDETASVIARHCTRQMVDNREMGITIIELHLAAARYIDLRPLIRDWGRTYAKVLAPTLARLGSQSPKADADLMVSTISGLTMTQLAVPRRSFEKNVLRPAVVRLLRSMSSEPQA